MSLQSTRTGLPSPDERLANVSVCSSCPSSSENGVSLASASDRPMPVGPRRTQSIAALDVSEATSNDEDEDLVLDDLDDEETYSEADERKADTSE
jgi:hypothetical protein